MGAWEFELADEAVDRIARVLERHPGGVFDADALTELDHNAYAVRVCTRDAVCREQLGVIQDRAAVYYSGRARAAERLGREIQRAIGALRARLRELRSQEGR